MRPNMTCRRVRDQLDGRELAITRAMESLRACLPQRSVALPIGAEKSFRGVVDLITMKAHVTPRTGTQAEIEEIPADLAEAAKCRTRRCGDGRERRRADGEFFEKGTCRRRLMKDRDAFQPSEFIRHAVLGAAQHRQRDAARPARRCVSGSAKRVASPQRVGSKGNEVHRKPATPSRFHFS